MIKMLFPKKIIGIPQSMLSKSKTRVNNRLSRLFIVENKIKARIERLENMKYNELQLLEDRFSLIIESRINSKEQYGQTYGNKIRDTQLDKEYSQYEAERNVILLRYHVKLGKLLKGQEKIIKLLGKLGKHSMIDKTMLYKSTLLTLQYAINRQKQWEEEMNKKYPHLGDKIRDITRTNINKIQTGYNNQLEELAKSITDYNE